MPTYVDDYKEFANTNPAGSTFVRTITGVSTTGLGGDTLVSLAVWRNFNFGSSEHIDISVEGVPLGRVLDLDPGNDAFASSFDAINEQKMPPITLKDARISAADWNAIIADGQIEVTYTLGSNLTSPGPGEFLTITFSEIGTAGVADSYTTMTNRAAITGNVADNDSLAPGQTIVLRTAPTGTLTLNADGSFSYQPPPDFAGTATFTYQIMAGATIAGIVDATITVNPNPSAGPVIASTFKITSLGTTNAGSVDYDSLAGDDRGSIAVTSSSVFLPGDNLTGRYSLSLVASASTGVRYDAVFGDIGTGIAYVFGLDATTPISGFATGSILTHLLELDGATGALSGRSIALSTPILLTGGLLTTGSGVFAGDGRVVIATNGMLYDIDFFGGVKNLGAFARPPMFGAETWAAFGVAEFFDGQLHLAYRDLSSDSINRIGVDDGLIETIANFPLDLSDMASFAASPQNNRWYFRYENQSGTFGGSRETLGYADATYDFGDQNLARSRSFAENSVNAAAQVIDSTITLTDADSSDFGGGRLIIGYSAGGGAQDQLSIRDVGNGAGQIGFEGTTVRFGGVVIGTVTSSGANGSNLIIAFNTNATVAVTEVLMENVTYQNTSDTPASLRTLSIVIEDGDGGYSTLFYTTIKVSAEQDPVFIQGQPLTAYPGDAVSADFDTLVTFPDSPSIPTYAATLADGSPLPSWLSFNPATMVLSGTPGTADVAALNVRITAFDGSERFAIVTVAVNVLSGQTLTGDGNSNVLAMRGGDDTIRGLGGADTLAGGFGDDDLDGGTGDDTSIFNVDFNSVTVVVEEGQIVVVSAEGRDVIRNIEHLQFLDGRIDLNDSNPLVDDLFYYAHNKDVWDAGADADAHFAAIGWKEGRDPNPEFSTNGYLAANPDIKAAGINPLAHYHEFGWKEGRDPSLSFDTRLYLTQNPDVAAANIDPLQHYIEFGRGEGRQAFQAVGPTVNGFDAQYYLFTNSDVAAAGVNPLAHFHTTGWQEGRKPNAYFDTAGYLARYTDVQQAGVDPLGHYLTFGWLEGRDPSAAFDTAAYLSANPDVAAAGVNPLQHFLQYGIYEGRTAFNDGVFA